MYSACMLSCLTVSHCCRILGFICGQYDYHPAMDIPNGKTGKRFGYIFFLAAGLAISGNMFYHM